MQEIPNYFSLTSEAQQYLQRRAVNEALQSSIGFFVWDPKRIGDYPLDKIFIEEFGLLGWKWRGRIVVPIRSPRDQIIGYEARTFQGDRWLSQYLMPSADWNPVFTGMSSQAVEKLYQGGDAWIVEGVFDLCALARVVPDTDVVLGTLRARLSDDHVEFLRRWCKRGTVNMVYDNDQTGQNQTHGWKDSKTGRFYPGAIQRLNKARVDCRAISYRGGKDPGEIWEKYGVEGMRRSFRL